MGGARLGRSCGESHRNNDEDQRKESVHVCDHSAGGSGRVAQQTGGSEQKLAATMVCPQGEPAVLLRTERGPRTARDDHPGGLHRW